MLSRQIISTFKIRLKVFISENVDLMRDTYKKCIKLIKNRYRKEFEIKHLNRRNTLIIWIDLILICSYCWRKTCYHRFHQSNLFILQKIECHQIFLRYYHPENSKPSKLLNPFSSFLKQSSAFLNSPFSIFLIQNFTRIDQYIYLICPYSNPSDYTW